MVKTSILKGARVLSRPLKPEPGSVYFNTNGGPNFEIVVAGEDGNYKGLYYPPSEELFAFGNCDCVPSPTVREGKNISYISRLELGVFRFFFANAAPDGRYSVVFSYSSEFNGQHTIGFLDDQKFNYFQLAFYSAANSANRTDKSRVNFAVFRTPS